MPHSERHTRNRVESHLSAVVVADVAGYSELMARDEISTMRALVLCREMFERTTAAYKGRVVNATGDSILVEFGSVVAAAEAALAIQASIAEANMSQLKPNIFFRMGIHIGEVIIDESDIFGDGINTAARLQRLAEPGGIIVSEAVYRNISTKRETKALPKGTHNLKGLGNPVSAYSLIAVGGSPAPGGISAFAPPVRKANAWIIGAIGFSLLAAGAGVWGPQFLSRMTGGVAQREAITLTVMPLVMIGDETKQSYVAAGLRDDLTTRLAQVKGLVLESSKDPDSKPEHDSDDPADPAKFSLRGTIRRIGEGVRLNIQLLDPQNRIAWANSFDAPWTEIFSLQDQIAGEIAKALGLPTAELSMAARHGGTLNTQAYDAFLRGQAARAGSADDIREAAKSYRLAVGLDPAFGRAWAGLAWIHWSSFGVAERERALGVRHEEVLPLVQQYLDQAQKWPSSYFHQIRADLSIYEGETAVAIEEAQKSIDLDISDPAGYEELSLASSLSGDGALGLAAARRAILLSSSEKSAHSLLMALAYFTLRQYRDGVRVLQANLAPGTNLESVMEAYLSVALAGQLGDKDQIWRSMSILAKAVSAGGTRVPSGLHARNLLPFSTPSEMDSLIEGLSKAGLPEVPRFDDLSMGRRLGGEEIKAVVFGRQIQGRNITRNSAWSRYTGLAGESSNLEGASANSGGRSRVEGDAICVWWPKFGRSCAAIFEHPRDAGIAMREYFWINAWDAYRFAVVK